MEMLSHNMDVFPPEAKTMLIMSVDALVAQESDGQKPEERTSRAALESQFCIDKPSPKDEAENRTRTTFLESPYPPSTAPLAELEPIAISDLCLGMHHRGRVLIIRAFGHAHRYLPVLNAVEDKNGDVERLIVCNADLALKAEQILPNGAVFALKEPYYKTTLDGWHNIRVDHPSDLIKLPAFHDIIPAELRPVMAELRDIPLQWKEEGNTAYLKKDYPGALDSYTEGIIACSGSDSALCSDLLRNRSVVNFQLQRYECASADAIASLIPDVNDNKRHLQNNTKARFRAGRAAYALERFTEAQGHFTESLRLSPEDKNSLRESARTEARINEQTFGNYDFDAMYKSAAVDSTSRRLDFASFTANVSIRDAGVKGRGLFAIRCISAGEVIVVEKAFIVHYGAEQPLGETYVLYDLHSQKMHKGNRVPLLLSTVQKMLHSEKEAKKLFDLYDGGYAPRTSADKIDGTVIVDTFRVASIISHNSFSCPDRSSSDDFARLVEGLEISDNQYGNSGVWCMASYINHACDGNAHFSFIGDMMIVRATKDIAADEEIVHPYIAVDKDHGDFQMRLIKSWSIQCSCPVCEEYTSLEDDQRQRRRSIVAEIEDLLESYPLPVGPLTKSTIAKAKKLQDKLQSTYKEPSSPRCPAVRYQLSCLHMWLVKAYFRFHSPENIVHHAVNVLANLGYGITISDQRIEVDHSKCALVCEAVWASMHASRGARGQGKMALAEQFKALAKEFYQMLYGHVGGFTEVFAKVVK